MDFGVENVEQSRQFVQNYKKVQRDNPGYDYEHYVKLPGHSDEKTAPYGHLAENGMITYNGVTFICDAEKSRLCLGDVSDKKNCLNIELSGGGLLVVNRDHLGALSDALDMFKPEDINRIVTAVMKDKKIREMRGEIEDDKAIMIGGKAYTQEEWEQTLAKFDEAAERLREEAEEAGAESEENADNTDIHIAYRKLRSFRRDKE